MSARLLVDAKASLGECCLWCERGEVLYWTDIQACTLSAWHAADGRVRTWTLPERVGSFALCGDSDQLLLGLASGIAVFDTRTQALSAIVPVERENPALRINDGRCDPQGRFVFGMFDPRSGPPVGWFYRVHADLRVERLPLPPHAVANSIAFSPDGETLYFTDSPTRTIFSARYFADGRIDAVRPFARVPVGEGFPDGSTVDSEGGLWNARWQGGCVVRYDAGGRESARLAVPAWQPTCAAFGGPLRDQLFVTSARIGLDAARLEREPQSGGVFALQTAWHGLPEHRFALA